MAIALITSGNVTQDVWVWGWGLTNCRRTGDTRQTKRQLMVGKKKSSRDWGKGNWIGETDKEKSWAKYSQKLLAYFSTCSRASHAAIVDWEEKIVTTSKRLSRRGAALWKAWNKTARLGQMKCTEDKREKKAYPLESLGIKSKSKPCVSFIDVLKPECINRNKRWKASRSYIYKQLYYNSKKFLGVCSFYSSLINGLADFSVKGSCETYRIWG